LFQSKERKLAQSS